MSILDIAAEVEQESRKTTEPPCVVGKALRLLHIHNPADVDEVKGWIAKGKSRVEVAEILTRYVAAKTAENGAPFRISAGSVGSHDRGECTCDRYGLA